MGFEPTPPKRIELGSIALDHSATNAYNKKKTNIYVNNVVYAMMHRREHKNKTKIIII